LFSARPRQNPVANLPARFGVSVPMYPEISPPADIPNKKTKKTFKRLTAIAIVPRRSQASLASAWLTFRGVSQADPPDRGASLIAGCLVAVSSVNDQPVAY
jgi:hypothetical protein